MPIKRAEVVVPPAHLQGARLDVDVAVGVGEEDLIEAAEAFKDLAADHGTGECHGEDHALLGDVVGDLGGMEEGITAAGQSCSRGS